MNGGWGIPIGRGSLGVFGEFRDRQPTNRAWADPLRGRRDRRGRLDQRHRPGDPQEQPGAAAQPPLGRRAGKGCAGVGQLPACRSTRRAAARSTASAATATATASAIPTGATSTAPATGPRSTRSASCRPSSGLVTDYSMAGGLRGAGVGVELRSRRASSGTTDSTTRSATPSTRPWARASTWPAPRGPTACSAPATIRAFPTSCRSSRDGCCVRSWSPASTSPSRSRWVCPSRSTWPSAPPSGGSATRSARASWRRTSTAGRSTRAGRTWRREDRSRSRASRRAMRPIATAPTSASTPTRRPTCRIRSSPRRRCGSRTTATSAAG